MVCNPLSRLFFLFYLATAAGLEPAYARIKILCVKPTSPRRIIIKGGTPY